MAHDVVIANQPKDTMPGKYRYVIVDRAIPEAKQKSRGDAILAYRLRRLTYCQGDAFKSFQGDESVTWP